MTYIFEHIFKTAGTTFHHSYLVGAFAPKERFIVRGTPKENAEDLRYLAELPPEKKASLKIIAGHNTGALRPHFPNTRHLSLVRDPVDRAISGYLHAKHHPDAWDVIGKRIHEERITLGRFVEADLFAEVTQHSYVSLRDGQARILLGREPAQEDLRDPQRMLEAVRERFSVIGHTGEFERFLFLLHLSEGFPLVLFNNRLVRANRGEFRPSPEEIEVIRERNPTDQVLFELLSSEFRCLIEETWTSAEEEAFGRYQKALEVFRKESRGDINAIRKLQA